MTTSKDEAISRRATNDEIREWAERHDLANALGSCARDAFEDAESLHQTYAPGTATIPAPAVAPDELPPLAVWYGSMPESNGKSNFTAVLMRKDSPWEGEITIERSEYPDRVRYEADRVRYLIGELTDKPFILDYDADKHSGYVAPAIAMRRAAAEPTVTLADALTDPDQVPHLIVFDDSERKPEMVIGSARARYRYGQVSTSWNAHLFVKIDSNSSDCTIPSAAAEPMPTSEAVGVRKATELLPKLHSLFNRLRNPSNIRIKSEADSRTIGDASELCRTIINANLAAPSTPSGE